MDELESRFAAWVIRARWLVIAVSVALTALAASGIEHLSITNSYRVYFGPDDPQRVAYERMERTYTKDDSVMLVIAPERGDVFSREMLGLVESLTEKAWQIPYSNRVDSITNYQHTEAHGDDLVVADLVKDAARLTEADLQRIRSVALAEPQLRDFLVAADARVTAVNVNILLPGIDEVQEQPRMIGHVRELVAEFESAYPDVRIYVSGMGAFHVATSESAVQDMNIRGPLSFAVMFLLIAFLSGGIIGTVTTLLVFTMSVAAAMGVSGYLGFPITPTGAGAPNIILTVAVASSVHILLSYFHELRAGRSRYEAVAESLRINVNPVALANITTALGFLALNFSESPPFQMLGTTVAIGVLVSLVLALTFLPALLAVMPTGRVHPEVTAHPWIDRFGDGVVRHRRRLLWGMTVAVGIVVANIPRNDLNDRFLEFFDETVDFRVATDFMIDNLTGLYSIHYSLDSGEPGGISDPEFLHLVEAFAGWWRAQPETEHVAAITDTLKRLNRNMHGDDAAQYRLPATRDLAAQYLLLYEMSLPYGLDLNNQINVDKSTTRIVATLRPISVQETLAVTRRAESWLAAHAPRIGHDGGTGMVMMFTHLFERNITSMLVGTTAALVAISVLIMIALRSARVGALSLVANLAPIGMGFGIWGLIDGNVGLSLSLVASMTFGIVIDDTVHFLSKYLRARRERGLAPEDAVRYAFNTVGQALVVTSIVLVAGFLVLSTSHFGLNADMGLSVAIVILCALMTVLLLLPPLLIKLEERRADAATVCEAPAGGSTA